MHAHPSTQVSLNIKDLLVLNYCKCLPLQTPISQIGSYTYHLVISTFHDLKVWHYDKFYGKRNAVEKGMSTVQSDKVDQWQGTQMTMTQNLYPISGQVSK